LGEAMRRRDAGLQQKFATGKMGFNAWREVRQFVCLGLKLECSGRNTQVWERSTLPAAPQRRLIDTPAGSWLLLLSPPAKWASLTR